MVLVMVSLLRIIYVLCVSDAEIDYGRHRNGLHVFV